MRYLVPLFAAVVLLVAPAAAQAGTGETRMTTQPSYYRVSDHAGCAVELSSRLGYSGFHLYVLARQDNCGQGWTLSGSTQMSSSACFSHNESRANENISWYTLCHGPGWYGSESVITASLPDGWRYFRDDGFYTLGGGRYLEIRNGSRTAIAYHNQVICACS